MKKVRQCFIYEQQYFMVDTFLNVDGTPSILRIETTKEAQEIKIPPFVKILREVTNDDGYETRFMADQEYKMAQSDRKEIEEKLKMYKQQEKELQNNEKQMMIL